MPSNTVSDSSAAPAARPARLKKAAGVFGTSKALAIKSRRLGASLSIDPDEMSRMLAQISDMPLVNPAPAPAPKPPEPKRPSFYAFVKTGVEMEGSEWTTEKVAEALTYENWRERSVGETIKEFDIVQLPTESGFRYEPAQCFKNQEITAEDMEVQGYIIHTMEGGGKPRKPVVVHETKEFAGMMTVPSGMVVKLPTEEAEAIRFFGCSVIGTEVIEKGKTVHCFYPVPRRFADRTFRAVFSRIFSDFTKKYLRDTLRSLIPHRGQGICLKPGISLKKMMKVVQDGKTVTDRIAGKTVAKWMPLNSDEVYSIIQSKFNIPTDTIKSLLGRTDYTPPGSQKAEPFRTFMDRMLARTLKPGDYGYDRAIGIEIETVSPIDCAAAQKKIPHYMRATTDGSIKTASGASPRDSGVQFGVEYRILCNRKHLDTSVKRATEALNKIGVSVNKSCGLHVHFDMRHKTKIEAKELATKMIKWVKALKDLLPSARRSNTYCSFDIDLEQHYSAVGIGSYDKHQTIEVRAAASTTSATKILHWIRLIEAIMEAKFVPPAIKMNGLDALKMLDLSPEDAAYWIKRYNHVNGLSADTSFYGDITAEDEGI